MTEETRTVFDPFHGKNVEISDRLTDRLRGKYACGPMLENGEPEFGWRQMEPTSINLEAAAEIERLQSDLTTALERVKELERDRDMWNADSVRLSSGLIAINLAPECTPASVLRSIAYDIALNCMPKDMAEFQIAERTRAVLQSSGGK